MKIKWKYIWVWLLAAVLASACQAADPYGAAEKGKVSSNTSTSSAGPGEGIISQPGGTALYLDEYPNGRPAYKVSIQGNDPPHPSRVTVRSGGSVDMRVVVWNVTEPPLAGSSLYLNYDPEVISSVSCLSSRYTQANVYQQEYPGRFLFEGYDTFGRYTGDVVVAVLRLTANASAPQGASTGLNLSGPRLGQAFGTPVWGPFWQVIDTSFEDATLQVGNQTRTWTVCSSGCDFTSIQKAINHASDGDTILVQSGEYPELLTVNKTLTIRGQDRTSTIVNGTYSGNVINITADGVVLENLTVTAGLRYHGPDHNVTPFGIGIFGINDVTISRCRITDCQWGIVTEMVSGLTLDRNEIDGNDFWGVMLKRTSLSTISSNYLHDNMMGILAAFSGEGLNCTGNEIIHNKKTGLCFIDGLPGATIENNRVEDNCYLDFSEAGDYDSSGGYFEWVEDSVLRNNRFIHNGGVGLDIGGMKDSVVEGNVMEDNYAGFSYGDMNLQPNNTISLSNTVDGQPILYLEEATDRDLIGSQYATIYCIECQNITIHDSIMTMRNGFGIIFRGGREVTIRNNSVSNNLFQNILLAAVTDSTIHGNQAENAGYGIGVIDSYNVTVLNNTAIGNVHGIAAASDCEDVLLSGNLLENNSVGFSFEFTQAPEDGDGVNCSANVIRGGHSEPPVMDLGLLFYQSENVSVADARIEGLYEGAYIHGGEGNKLARLSIQDCVFGIEISPALVGWNFLPSRYHRIIQNNVTVERNAFFTDTNSTTVYGNHIFLNSLSSVQEPESQPEREAPSEWTTMSGLPVSWGLPRSETFSWAGDSGDRDREENIFHTDTPVTYKYRKKFFTGYLGNYWNWYNGTDTHGNGVGTTPYQIRRNNTDYYPLLSPASAYILTSMEPGIGVEKVALPSRAKPSDKVVFIIKVRNTGGTLLDPVKVVDLLPEGMTYLLSQPAGELSGNEVTWDLGALNPGEGRSLKIIAVVDPCAQGTLRNLVRARGYPPTGDAVSSRDTAEVVVSRDEASRDTNLDQVNSGDDRALAFGSFARAANSLEIEKGQDSQCECCNPRISILKGDREGSYHFSAKGCTDCCPVNNVERIAAGERIAEALGRGMAANRVKVVTDQG